ncbi:MAG: CoA transferase [Pseudomonadales bacterium]|nr:CoA transferase [Pseudomonadales bacterium]
MADLIFEGLKVWDMSWVGVGPLTARYLADNGATVIRMDSSKRVDILRISPPFQDGKPGFNNSMFYGDFNCSKLGLGLDMASEGGRVVAREMAQWADVILESFTPGNMAKWGLSYEEVSRDNPGVVMLSTCMQGQTGPRAHYPGFGNLMASNSGYYEITGWADAEPVPVYGAYTDFIAHRFTTTALIAALDHKARTGQGQYIDVSQFEAAVQYFGPEVLDYSVNGHTPTRAGNADPVAAPHGAYPCIGEDRWIAIAVESDYEWRIFKDKMGNPTWAEDAKFATLSTRKENEDELNQQVAEWTSGWNDKELQYYLQPDIAAGSVQDQFDLYEDAQTLYRGYFVDLEHSEMGKVPYNGTQTLFSKTPTTLSKASPCVGEDSRQVLKDCLGFSDQKIDGLVESGAVEITGPNA